MYVLFTVLCAFLGIYVEIMGQRELAMLLCAPLTISILLVIRDFVAGIVRKITKPYNKYLD